MAVTAAHMRLYLVTDRALCARFGLVNTITAAIKGGVTMVQLRDKNATTTERVEQAQAIKTALAGTNVPFVINDDVEAAISAEVDGVHVGQSDSDPAKTRARLAPGKILGMSCENEADVRAVDANVVDYLGLGTIFATGTKDDLKPLIGLEGLTKMVALTDLPTVAIGGLKAQHNQDILNTGTHGLAVVSAICGHPDPTAAAQAFFKGKP